MLNPTPAERMVDKQGYPYFLWDCDMTLDELRNALRNPNRALPDEATRGSKTRRGLTTAFSVATIINAG